MVTFTGLLVPIPVQVVAGNTGLLSRMSPAAPEVQEIASVLPDLETIKLTFAVNIGGVTAPLVVSTPPSFPAW